MIIIYWEFFGRWSVVLCCDWFVVKIIVLYVKVNHAIVCQLLKLFLSFVRGVALILTLVIMLILRE